MTTDSQYSWTSFYMEFADKLLAFKDDRQALIATLRGVYADLGDRRPNLSSAGESDDTDPFTVLTLFNRGRQGLETRRNILNGMSIAFDLASPVPEDFVGVPVMANRQLIFHATLKGSRQSEDTILML